MWQGSHRELGPAWVVARSWGCSTSRYRQESAGMGFCLSVLDVEVRLVDVTNMEDNFPQIRHLSISSAMVFGLFKMVHNPRGLLLWNLVNTRSRASTVRVLYLDPSLDPILPLKPIHYN